MQLTSTSHLGCDLLTVGNGINGVSIAHDVVGRGLLVALCRKDDLTQYTSSASTKLIHGRPWYFEYYEFSLMCKALQEREVLLHMAPHIMQPLRFVMLHNATQHLAWTIHVGLFLYGHLVRRRSLPGSKSIKLARYLAGQSLKAGYTRGSIYSGGQVDDARLVVLNAHDAVDRGTQALTRTRCLNAEHRADGWHALLAGPDSIRSVHARTIVDVVGSWTVGFAYFANVLPSTHGLRLIKGSHIVVRWVFDHPPAYISQSPDGRIVFVILYQNDSTLISTTDLEYKGSVDQVTVDAGEIRYLCETVSRHSTRQLTPSGVVWSYSGVRPLLDDSAANASTVMRDYLVKCETGADGTSAPLINARGGKITTYRKLTEEALDQLAPHLPLADKPSWAATASPPGGDLKAPGQPVAEYTSDDSVMHLQECLPWVPAQLALRYAHQYSTRTNTLLAGAT